MVAAAPSLGVRTSAQVTNAAPRQPPTTNIHSGGTRQAMEVPCACDTTNVSAMSTTAPATNDAAAAASGIPRPRDSCALIGPCRAISMPATIPTIDQTMPIARYP